MPTGSDYRQQIILALQEEGADVPGRLIDALRQIRNEQALVNEQAREGSITAKQQAEMMARLVSEGDKFRSWLRSARDEQAGLNAALEESLVPLNKLIVDSLKFADAQEKIAGKTTAAADRKQQLQDEAALQEHLGRKTREAAEATQKAERDSIDARVRGTQAVRDEIKAVEDARVAAIKASGERAQALALAERRIADATEAGRVAAIKASGDRAQGYARAERQTSAFTDSIKKLEEATLKEEIAQRKRKQGLDESTRSSRGTSQAVLELSRGIEDFATGGFIGILNNIPGTIQGIGQTVGYTGVQVAALTGGISLLATGIYAAWKNWGAIEKAFGSTVLETTLNRVTLLKDRLKELEDKTVKTGIDYSDIDIAKKKIAELTEAESAYQRLVSGKTKTQQEAGKRVTEAVIEEGGGTDYLTSADRIVAAMQMAVPKPDSDQTTAHRKRLVEQEEALKNAPERNKEIFQHYVDVSRAELNESTALDREAQKKAFQDILGGAAAGSEKDIAFVQDLAEKNAPAFDKQGVGPGFLPGLIRARRPRIQEEKSQENIAKITKDNQEQTEKVARENVARAKVEADEAKASSDELKAEAKAKHDADTLRIKARGEFTKVMDDNEKKLIDERKKKVDEVDQAFTNTAAAAFAANDLRRAQGAPVARTARQERQFLAQGITPALPPQVLGRRVDERIATDLRRTRQDPGLAPDIRTKGANLYDTRRTEAMARTPLPDPTQAIAGFGEQQGRAMADQAQATAALIQVLGGLQSQAMRTDMQTQRNLQQAFGLQQNQRRGAQTRKSQLTQ